MPHFYASKLDSTLLPKSTENFAFILEAWNLKDKKSLILAESLHDKTQKILLSKQEKNGKFLIKFNKHYKVPSKELIKQALKDYATITNANITSHNLNAHKSEVDSAYLLNYRGICNEIKAQNAMLEIGFGSGRHILNLAKTNPNSIIIGLEIYRPAILQVLRQIKLSNLQNLFIANIDARILCEILPENALDRIFLHFPVPWDKNPQRRVFSKHFLQNVIRILKKDGFFELVTDSKEYFNFAKNLSKNYKCKIDTNATNAVVSKYEARWRKQQKQIFKLQIFPKMSLFGFFTRNRGDDSADLSKEFELVLQRWKATLNADLIKKILYLNLPKICKEEYFLHIKSVYESGDGFVIFATFGAYYAPSSAFFAIRENSVEVLSDIIYTRANIAAMNLLTEF